VKTNNDYLVKAKVQEKDEQIQYVKEKYDSEIALLKFVTRTAFVHVLLYHIITTTTISKIIRHVLRDKVGDMLALLCI
jgi:hypothetical protein